MFIYILSLCSQVRLLDTIDACIPHPNEAIQEQACKGLAALMSSYFPVGIKGPSERLQKRVVEKYNKEVRKSVNPAATRGFSSAIGYLPAKLLAPSLKVLDISLSTMFKASRLNAAVGNEKDAETRRNALVALSRICKTVGIEETTEESVCLVPLSPTQFMDSLKAFFLAMTDYNTDRRGDVGSWSRMAAMDGLETLVFLVSAVDVDRRKKYMENDMCHRIVGNMLKQLSEKLDAVRIHAGGCFIRILTKSNFCDAIPKSQELIQMLGPSLSDKLADGNINWADASVTFPLVMKFASLDPYFEYVISGLIISVGCLTESVSKSASAVLLQWVKDSSNDVEKLGQGEYFFRKPSRSC